MNQLDPKLIECLQNRYWRMNNLYYIKTKKGERVQFKMNWMQEDLFWNMHNFNLILKARA